MPIPTPTILVQAALTLLLVGPDGPGRDERAAPPAAPQPAWTAPPHRHTVYLNFLGGTFNPGDNAAENTTACATQERKLSGFQGDERAALAIVELFKEKMAPFGVRVVYEQAPPRYLPYSMIVFSGDLSPLGVANAPSVTCVEDCGDLQWRDTSFVKASGLQSSSAITFSALSIAGITWGLDFVTDPDDIMGWGADSPDRSWGDACTDLSPKAEPKCATTHAEFCPMGQQSATDELLAIFGPNTPDTEPPKVQILSPADGATLPVGEPLVISADLSDDHEGFGWHLVVPELGIDDPCYDRQKEWTLQGVPEGTYTIRVEALDHDGNIGLDELSVQVGEVPAPTTGDETGGTGGGGDGSSSGGGGDDSATSATGGAEGEGGCACRAHMSGGSRGDGLLGLLGFAGLVLYRRRGR